MVIYAINNEYLLAEHLRTHNGPGELFDAYIWQVSEFSIDNHNVRTHKLSSKTLGQNIDMLSHTHNLFFFLLVDYFLSVEFLPRLFAQAAEVLQKQVAIDTVVPGPRGELLDQPPNLHSTPRSISNKCRTKMPT